jgi:hypothetical protein
MKFTLLITLLLTLAIMPLISCSEHTDAAKEALNEARHFAQSGEYAKALERHEWYHKNALGIQPSYYGVRLSFALNDWKNLGEKYPPALTSLKATRDAGVAALTAGTASREIFHDVSSINHVLKEDHLTITTFKHLHAKHPILAKQCFSITAETLISEGEIDLFTQYADDLPAYMMREIDQYNATTKHMKARNDPLMALSLKYFDNKLVEMALSLMQIAQKREDPSTAEKIREMTAANVTDPRLRAAR